MGRILRNSLLSAAVAAGALAGAEPAAALGCSEEYMACSASTVVSSSDFLHDDSCAADYVACLGGILRFI